MRICANFIIIGFKMPGVCELTGLGVLSGNKVSHSNRKTRRKFHPNLQPVTLSSDILRKKMKLKIATRTLRTVDFKGGLDAFLINTKSSKLSTDAKVLKKRIQLKLEKESLESDLVKAKKVRRVVEPKKKLIKRVKNVEAIVASTKKTTAKKTTSKKD
jgi:large subunit ribosomal protein L28